MKRQRKGVSWILLLAVLVALLVFLLLLYQKVVLLTNRLAYLQDSTDIILSDVGGLETNFARILKEETSLVEDFSIRIADMDFVAENYRAEVRVIPKEYTDSTKISVFFGTMECVLSKNGYEYCGSAVLPLAEDYGGNLTFLFANGKKKNTEVFRSYEGVRHRLEQVLSGSMAGEPGYRDGTLTLRGRTTYALNGVGQYEFDRLELVACQEGGEVFCQDILEAEERQPDVAGEEKPVDTDAGRAEETGGYPLSEVSGNAPFELEYRPDSGGAFRMFLRAHSVEGYCFEYELFRCVLAEEAGEVGEMPAVVLDEESCDRTPSYVVFDRHGGKLVIE